jgi:hypothetical protein
MFYVFILALAPMLLLNLPVGLFARLVAEKHQKEALAKSNVKLTVDTPKFPSTLLTVV